MPQTGSAGVPPSGRGDRVPPRIRAFDPLGEIAARDTRVSGAVRDGFAGRRGSPGYEYVEGHRGGTERDGSASRAAARAALAESFAERFGIDEGGPSAAALADRFGFRYETTDAGTGTGAAVSAGRRTVTIRGDVSARGIPPAERTIARGGRTARRGAGLQRSVAPGLRADRVALIAVGLGLLLAFLAATSAHAAELATLVR